MILELTHANLKSKVLVASSSIIYVYESKSNDSSHLVLDAKGPQGESLIVPVSEKLADIQTKLSQKGD